MVEADFMGRCYQGARSNLDQKIGAVLKVAAADDFRFENPQSDWTEPISVPDLPQGLLTTM